MNIQLRQGDITQLEVDVIVNAANTSLLGGGGVDGAIHRSGGKSILEDCRKIRRRQGGCKVGEAVITTAGNLLASKVIHTVGPKWNLGKSGEAEKLESCYVESLKLADANGFESIAFPNISTGIYGYPKHAAASIAVKAVQDFDPENLLETSFVCYDEENYEVYKKLLAPNLE
jgi:O-acetyl-ADP-ribose deacetylase (regulator of RNase III)